MKSTHERLPARALYLRKKLRDKIKEGTLTAGVVGLGYVGLPLAATIAAKKIKVLGFDVDENKVSKLRNGQNYIKDVDVEQLTEILDGGYFIPTNDFSRLSDVDVICITVPTPINKEKLPDLDFVIQACTSVAENLKKEQLVILESTTYPGTTDEVALPILERSGLRRGKDFYLAFAPERIDPGNEVYDTHNTPKVVGGIDTRSTRLAGDFFRLFVDEVHEVSSTKAAEMSKILENTFRLVNVCFINEMALIASGMGIDIWEVIEAAKTKPFGFMPFYPGPGLGGHCIPVDPYYLSYKAKSCNIMTRFIDLSSHIDDLIQDHVLEMIKSFLREMGGRVLVLGAAYKKDIDDFRESPAVKIMERLEREPDIEYDFYDAYIPEVHEGEFQKRGLDEIDSEIVAAYDVVAIITDHSDVDYQMVLNSARAIVDTRNVIRSKSAKILKL